MESMTRIEMLKVFYFKALKRAGFFKRILFLMARQIFFGAKISCIYVLKKRSSKRDFFILCEHRTGSNLLISYLNAVPGVLFDGEILSRYHGYGLRRRWISRKTIFRHIRHSLSYRCQEVRGAKIFFGHLQELKISLDGLLKEFPEARWFVLYRKNILEQYLSLKIAKQSQQWTLYKNSPPARNVRIEFNPHEAVLYRDQMRSWYQAVRENPLLCERSLWISYEDLAKDPQALFDEKVFSFSNLPPSPVRTRTIKQNRRPSSEVIANYAAVRAMIEQTDFTQSYEP